MFLEQTIKVKHIFIAAALVVAFKAYAAYTMVYQIQSFLSQMVQR